MNLSGCSSKIKFATDVVARGAIYIKNRYGQLQDEVAKPWKLNLFVLDSAHYSRLHRNWPWRRQHLEQLQEEHNVQHRVLILYYDASTTEAYARPVLKQMRREKKYYRRCC
ncbi:hypothetical protein HBI70_244030 [Parastagonospora nodorum]|nr:hypothetical protein HBI70_244030 [Parastagonospora nodorum]KAH5296588.1 hypothetical protein HBI50_227650 [Parastagonospora nodorum]KAH6386240.1 hypothetical protein HBI60_222020 [Parastagonospora nodorum]